MDQTSVQSVFQTSVAGNAPAGRAWQSYIGSVIVHTFVVLLLLSVTIPAVRPVRRAVSKITILAPVLPQPAYQVKLPPRPRVIPPVAIAKVALPKPPPAKILNVPAPKPVVPVTVAAVPEIKTPEPRVAAEIKPDLPETPKPPVQTGVFQQNSDVAKTAVAPKLTVGGFGDPNGVAISANAKPGVTMAKVGSFDAPNGGGIGGGSGRSASGAVKASAFGSGGMASADGNRASGQVRSSGFNDTTMAQAPKQGSDAGGALGITPVEILYKPRPAYSPEARNLRLEGRVSLEVVFLSNGSIRVVRVVQGLGHGLDEAAEQAALKVRFKPAMRGGVPVDTDATINITFELS